MKLFIKQKVFSIRDKFNIYDENQNVKFTCQGKIFSIGKKFHVYDEHNQEVAYIHQKILAFLSTYYINKNEEDIACVKRKFTLFKPSYNIPEFGWHVQGNLFAHEYKITKDNVQIVTVSKKWISWGDCYEIDINDDADLVNAICTVIIIDSDLFSNTSKR